MMKNLKSIAGAVAFMVMWAGAAIAMPTAFFAPDETPTTVADLTIEDPEPIPVVEEEDKKATKDDAEDETDGDANGDNHGKAVSTAAHCDLKGRAKGALVSSVARDKSATVESAQAACDAAVATSEAAGVQAKPGGGPKPDRSSKPEKAPKAPKAAETPSDEGDAPVEEETSSDDSTTSGPPVNSGPPADKGPKKP
jgi:hypothetical protein